MNQYDPGAIGRAAIAALMNRAIAMEYSDYRKKQADTSNVGIEGEGRGLMLNDEMLEVEQSKNEVLHKLISDGVEFENVRRLIASWVNRRNHIIFAQQPDGRWVWRYIGNNRPSGVQGRYHSFHEMLEAFLELEPDVAATP